MRFEKQIIPEKVQNYQVRGKTQKLPPFLSFISSLINVKLKNAQLFLFIQTSATLNKKAETF